MGTDRAHTYHHVWSALKRIEHEPVSQKPTSKLASKGLTYGGVVINAEGKLLLREPKNHYDGYVWTFPKGKPEAGETEEEVALREVGEETGVVGCVSKRIPGEFQGGTSKTIYFLMTLDRETGELDDETKSTAWVTAEEAAKRIQQTTNLIGRKRDLAVLKAAMELIG
jgi:ADP-ribose pyrophosphatase YjhB (NUDIX family)